MSPDIVLDLLGYLFVSETILPIGLCYVHSRSYGIWNLRNLFYLIGIDDGVDELAYKTKLFELLIECGIDIISLSNGIYNIDKTMIYPPKDDTMPIFEEAKSLAFTHRSILWNVAGNMEYALIHNSIVPDNLSLSLGRQLLSDPRAIIKIKNGQFEDIIPCSECNKCHYYSFDLPGIQNCDL